MHNQRTHIYNQHKGSQINLCIDVNVNMKWSCGHEGYLNLEWLRNHCYSAHTLEVARKNSVPTLVKKVLFCTKYCVMMCLMGWQ